jgi:DNA helicase-2/ATP-dependent DNA helicase PcrA
MDFIKLLTSSSLLVVGDADQSIYSWQGPHVGSLADFADEFKNYMGGVRTTVHLMENYRSAPNIVRAAEKVIGSSGKDEQRQSMKPTRESGPSPRVVACADEKGEANFVVDNILDMVIAGTVKPDATVTLIYRTNAQSRHLEEACVQKGLNYVIRGAAGGFYKRAEIKDCLCFLRWLNN